MTSNNLFYIKLNFFEDNSLLASSLITFTHFQVVKKQLWKTGFYFPRGLNYEGHLYTYLCPNVVAHYFFEHITILHSVRLYEGMKPFSLT